MDGTTEPIVAVLGHPIAGNPSQFAIERALESMQLDWRVLSLDVKPSDVATAINGAWVMGLRGVLLDSDAISPDEIPATTEGQDSGDAGRLSAPRTCFFRDPNNDSSFQSENAQSRWLEEVIQSHFHALEAPIGPVLLIGDRDSRFPSDMVDIDTQSPIAWAASESIEQSKLIVLSEIVKVDSWPVNDGTSMVIDLTAPQGSPADQHQGLNCQRLQELGYAVVDAEELRAAGLSQCLFRWTGIRPAIEVLKEAIEEYLAV